MSVNGPGPGLNRVGSLRYLAMVDLRARYPIDDYLVGLIQPRAGDVVLELGCGAHMTMAAAADRAGDLTLVGLDLDVEALDEGNQLLAAIPARHMLAVADLSRPLPLASGSVDGLLCHNVLEEIPDPPALLEEASRVMRPGALSVWSHIDFESVAISGSDPDLTRRVVLAYATTSEAGFAHADGQLGRKLAGLVRSSPLERVVVDTRVLASTEMHGPAEVRIKSTFALVRRASLAGQVDLTIDDLDEWMAGLVAADREGRFFYAHTTYIVVGRKS